METPNVDKKLSCFIIMPFERISYINKDGKDISLSKDDVTHLYEQVIKKAVESYKKDGTSIDAKRYESRSGNFMKGIVNELFNKDLVVAEITGMNPNVMYELGIRHTLRNNTIMIAQDTNQIPSDLAHYIAVKYDYPQKPADIEKCYTCFEAEMHKAIEERLQKWNESDNPIRDFIEVRNVFKNEERIKEIKGNVNVLNLFIESIWGLISYTSKAINSWGEGKAYPSPLIETDWASFYAPIIKSEKDLVYGKYIRTLATSLKAYENNLDLLRMKSDKLKISSLDSEAEKFQLGFVTINGYFWTIDKLKDYNNPIINDLLEIKKTWEAELAELTK